MDVAYLKRLRDMTWDVCLDLGDKWPTPNRNDSLAYAVTEVGEAIDADLRLRRTGDKRNNAKELSREHELAQAFMMVLKALGSKWEPAGTITAEQYELHDIACAVADAWRLTVNEYGTWPYACEYALSAIDTYCIGVEPYLVDVLGYAKERWG